MVKKTLVFHFFVPKDYKDNVAIRMHLECLKRYSSVFDSAIFSICFEDNDMSSAEEVEKDLMDCGYIKDVRFVLIENSRLTESITLKTHVIDNLDNIDGLVLFGHTKGVTNVKTYTWDVESKLKWIYSLYFYNLEFINEMEENLLYSYPYISTFYGPLRTTMDGGITFYYPGTFYWINPMNLYNDVKSGMVSIPKLSNRTFAENLPLIYKTSNSCHAVACHDQNWMEWYDLYNGDMDAVIRFFGDEDLFYNNYNEINKQII